MPGIGQGLLQGYQLLDQQDRDRESTRRFDAQLGRQQMLDDRNEQRYQHGLGRLAQQDARQARMDAIDEEQRLYNRGKLEEQSLLNEQQRRQKEQRERMLDVRDAERYQETQRRLVTSDANAAAAEQRAATRFDWAEREQAEHERAQLRAMAIQKYQLGRQATVGTNDPRSLIEPINELLRIQDSSGNNRVAGITPLPAGPGSVAAPGQYRVDSVVNGQPHSMVMTLEDMISHADQIASIGQPPAAPRKGALSSSGDFIASRIAGKYVRKVTAQVAQDNRESEGGKIFAELGFMSPAEGVPPQWGEDVSILQQDLYSSIVPKIIDLNVSETMIDPDTGDLLVMGGKVVDPGNVIDDRDRKEIVRVSKALVSNPGVQKKYDSQELSGLPHEERTRIITKDIADAFDHYMRTGEIVDPARTPPSPPPTESAIAESVSQKLTGQTQYSPALRDSPEMARAKRIRAALQAIKGMTDKEAEATLAALNEAYDPENPADKGMLSDDELREIRPALWQLLGREFIKGHPATQIFNLHDRALRRLQSLYGEDYAPIRSLGRLAREKLEGN